MERREKKKGKNNRDAQCFFQVGFGASRAPTNSTRHVRTPVLLFASWEMGGHSRAPLVKGAGAGQRIGQR
jgi:hypothetical protein